MGTNNKNYHDQRTFNNTSPSNKQKSGYVSGSQRPSPSKSINIRTPNKNAANGNVAGYNNRNNYFNNNSSNTRLSLSGSPTTSYFAASKCFESPSPDSLPRPPANWMTGSITNITDESTIKSSTTTQKPQATRARKSLVMPAAPAYPQHSCAMEYAAAFSDDTNDHFTQSLKLLLNVNA